MASWSDTLVRPDEEVPLLSNCPASQSNIPKVPCNRYEITIYVISSNGYPAESSRYKVTTRGLDVLQDEDSNKLSIDFSQIEDTGLSTSK